jgi:hypothetical protein
MTTARKPGSPARESARNLVGRLHDLVGTLDEIERRGGIVATLDDARVGERDCRKLVAGLQRIRDRARNFVAAIGTRTRTGTTPHPPKMHRITPARPAARRVGGSRPARLMR